MQKLNRHMKSTEQLLIKTFKIAEEAQKEALRAYNDALDIYSKSSPTIPSMRSEKVNQDSGKTVLNLTYRHHHLRHLFT